MKPSQRFFSVPPLTGGCKSPIIERHQRDRLWKSGESPAQGRCCDSQYPRRYHRKREGAGDPRQEPGLRSVRILACIRAASGGVFHSADTGMVTNGSVYLFYHRLQNSADDFLFPAWTAGLPLNSGRIRRTSFGMGRGSRTLCRPRFYLEKKQRPNSVTTPSRGTSQGSGVNPSTSWQA